MEPSATAASCTWSELVGQLDANPVVRSRGNGVVCTFCVVTTLEEHKETGPILVEVRGRLAVLCGRHLVEGCVVRVEGQLALYRWVERNTGQLVSDTSVRANDVMVLEWCGRTDASAMGIIGIEDLPF
jgi:single-stranded DNA-binding protein